MLTFQKLPRGRVSTSPAAYDQAEKPVGRQKLVARKQKRNYKGGVRGDSEGVCRMDNRHWLRKKSREKSMIDQRYNTSKSRAQQREQVREDNGAANCENKISSSKWKPGI